MSSRAGTKSRAHLLVTTFSRYFPVRVWQMVLLSCLLASASKLAASVHLLPGDIIVTDQGQQGIGGFDGRIIRVDPATGAQTIISAGGLLFDPNSVTMDASGNLIVSDFNSSGGAIIRVDPATGTQTLIASGNLLSHPRGVTLDSAGNIFATTDGGTSSTRGAVRIDAMTHAQSYISTGGLFRVPEHLLYENANRLIVVDAQAMLSGNGALIAVSNGNQSFISSGAIRFPIGLAITSGGYYVTEHDTSASIARLDRVDPLTQAITTVSSGGNLVSPGDVAWNPFRGDLIVADLDAAGGGGAIIGIDPATGAQSVLPAGGNFFNPTGIMIVPEPVGAALVWGLFGIVRTRRR